jgi:hypothetical protein
MSWDTNSSRRARLVAKWFISSEYQDYSAPEWRIIRCVDVFLFGALRDKARRMGAGPVMPYPRNQMKRRQILRVDKRFRSHGPRRLKCLYGRWLSVERTVSLLKIYFGLC